MTQMQFQLGDSIQERFERFHEQHPEVYVELARLAREARSRGVRRLGIRLLWERLRWQMLIDHPVGEYSFDDHFTSHYSRLLMQREPDLSGMFETRGDRA